MKLPEVVVKTSFTPFAGGYDVVTPPLLLQPGFCKAAQNYEHDINGGYVGCKGYERFDGSAAPSAAIYAVLTVNIPVVGDVVVGDILTDNAGTAFGTVIALTATQAIMTRITGLFSTGNIKVGGVVVGTCVGTQLVDGAATSELQAQYKNLAADEYRNTIFAVPGSGDILGVHQYDNVKYAFRNNAGGTATGMYKSTPAGWVAVPLGFELSFTSGGTFTPQEGDVITGATSGATATIGRVALESGTFAAGTAAGRFIFASQTGAFIAENINIGINTNVATVAGPSSAITFPVPNGRFDFINENFGGGLDTIRMYGCDGKNRGFEFDGTTLTPINTGMAVDAPNHIYSHVNHLFFSFMGSVQHSAPGLPFSWAPLLGAGEIAMGDVVTGFMQQAGSGAQPALSIVTRNKISTLYGTGLADWNLVGYKQEAGAVDFSIQQIVNTIMFDDRGITNLQASQVFGNFVDATLSRRIQPWLTDKRTKVTCSCIARDKNQYRLYFNDKYAIYLTFDNKKLIGMMPQLFSHTVLCVSSQEANDGTEEIYFGSDDGFVYQMETGTSFDGEPIEQYINLTFDNSRSPRVNKAYRGVTFEISGNGYAQFNFSYEIGYGSTLIGQPGNTSVTTNFSASFWDSFTWDAFVWDGQTLLPSECDMTGTAENVSLIIRSNSDYYSPLKFSGALIDYSPRRKLRA